ncbi:MAG: chromosome partitioning protein ParA [Gammaproteobacteria bacterium]|nr:chromosome partitioning protein ParA [Gammaproteobacteria bacterium]
MISPENKYESAIYEGFVRHRRFSPNTNEFRYPLFMFLLKIDEIPKILRSFWQLGTSFVCWARFNRGDYLGQSNENLGESVKTKIAELLGSNNREIEGEVFALCHLRYFGFYFSPLNIYFLKDGVSFKYALAEVSNTPWNERHYYLLDLDSLLPHQKQFHVSPFNPMHQSYQWKIKPPSSDYNECVIHIESTEHEKKSKVFDASLVLKRKPLTQSELNRVLIKSPVQTLSVTMGIYWQAFKLFLKRTPFYKHPGKNQIKIGKGTL